MTQENCKIELADIKLHLEWSKARFSVIDSSMSEEDRYNDTHTHSTFEVFFVTDGVLKVITHRNKIEYRNSIVIIPPHLPHCTVTDHTHVSVMYFKIEQTKKGSELLLFSQLSKILSDNITVLQINEERNFYIKKACELQSTDLFSSERVPHLMYLLFTNILSELTPSPKPHASEKHRNYIRMIQDYLTFHYNKKLPITELAKVLYLSPKQVARIIRKEYNCTFSEMLTSHRLEVACMLLIRSDMDVNKIALQVGYEYPANFFKHFKKAYGITPVEYRKKIQYSN